MHPTKHASLRLFRLMLLPAVLAACLGYLLSSNRTIQQVHAFSAGPPPGYTGAPGEEPEACAECHVPADAGTGQISITAPQTYVPGQTYSITVTHTNTDPTRLRWGFQLTALDQTDEKAGNLQNLDGLTQVVNNAGPGSSRQYIEHTASGTFIGQQNGASWTFNWTAPATDVGVVTFYTAGNQANNDGNTSGDNIYRTFVAAAPASSTPDFVITMSPSTRTVSPGGSAQYSVTVTPLAGFTGAVNLTATNLPAGVTASFNPTSININDATSKTAILTLNTTGATPLGNHLIDVNGQSGSVTDTAQITLRVVNPASADLSITKTASPNPGQVSLNLSYRIAVTNNGPASATGVTVTDTLPAGVTFVSATPSQGACSGTTTVTCGLGTLTVGTSAIVTIVGTPTTQGQINNTAVVTASESDFDTTNNTTTITTLIQPAGATPTMLDPNLIVSTVVSGLDQPTTMAFLGSNDFLILERTTGRVRRVTGGAVAGTVLDLAVNSASERGLLGIALHPQFARNGFVYLFWTESSTGADTPNTDDITLLANRVDRYVWNGSALTFDRNLIKLRALQQDANQPSRANHNGGVLRFGQDGKLYIMFGDNGRRGFLQNIVSGGPVPDDQFGGPQPDDAHMTGVILRLNDDGSTPSDNPFFNVNSGLTGEAAANIKKVFGYGFRNGFGMAVDPLTGNLWIEENGDDAFDELNRVRPGFNGGWIQAMGPISRVDQFKSIETTYGNGTLQQLRWPPTNIADTPQTALSRLFTLSGSQYTDPEFSWKYAVAPSPIGFVRGTGLGPQFEGDMLVGASRTTLSNGFLFRFKLNTDRQHFEFTDPRLADLVADNDDKFDLKESESLLIGRDFGVTTDIQTGPNGNVFVVSLSNGAVYEIKSKPSTVFVATLTGAQEVPPTNSTATGTAVLVLSPDEATARLALSFSGLSSAQTDAHIHGPALPGVTAPPVVPLPSGQIINFGMTLSAAQVQDLKNGLWYVNVHSSNFPNGEIRGQFGTSPTASSLQLDASKYSVGEGEGSLLIGVTRLGNVSSSASIVYSANDSNSITPCNVNTGSALSRCDYSTVVNTLTFAPGESFKSFAVPIIDDSYDEGDETFTITLTTPQGGLLGPSFTSSITIIDNDVTTGTNPIFTTPFFVRQHYLDFLGREPESTEPWTALLNGCSDVNNNPACDRLTVSEAFLGSPEFRIKGYFVYRLYKLAFDRLPQYTEIVGDMSSLTGQTPLEFFARKASFTNEFVLRPEFTSAFGGMTNAQYVTALMGRYTLTQITTPDPAQPDGSTKVTFTSSDLLNQLNGGMLTRAQVLRAIADSDQVIDREFIQGFVAMQYYGYLRRTPETAGYNAWVNYLTANPTDFRTMVHGFMNSVEYRMRFGPAVP